MALCVTAHENVDDDTTHATYSLPLYSSYCTYIKYCYCDVIIDTLISRLDSRLIFFFYWLHATRRVHVIEQLGPMSGDVPNWSPLCSGFLGQHRRLVSDGVRWHRCRSVEGILAAPPCVKIFAYCL